MEFLWQAPDGLSFPCEQWLPEHAARGAFVCIHGLGGAATDFHTLGEAAAHAGFATFSLNLRGQGHDPVPHRRGASLDLDHLEADFSAFGREVLAGYAGLPVFWGGESMGSLILCHLLASPGFVLPVQGAIFSVPVVELSRPTPAVVRLFLRLLAKVVPRVRLRPSWFVSGNAAPLAITRDEEHAEKLRSAPHHIPAFTFGFLHALDELMLACPDLASRVHVPSLVLAAGRDVFIRPEQVREWFECLGTTDKEIHIYPDAYHLLWNDWDRAHVLADVLAWLERQHRAWQTKNPTRH